MTMMNESIFIELTDNKGCVQGYCTDKFRVVLDEFVKNFEARGEVGASIVLTHEGETVVDLWGGRNSQKNQKPWTQDTLSMVFSSTKGIVALVANVLIAQGLLAPLPPGPVFGP
jgi:CubicO group peptidase (beta-lactamase class C family)